MATGRYLYCTVVPRVSALSPFRRPASRYAQSARSGPITAAIPTITLKIEADLLTQARFRWLLCEGDQVLLRCQHSFETMGEAEADGNKALEKRIKERAPPSSEWPSV